ncbi:MAG: oligopeptide/dipeptide ABC transporter ATP-binding protein [Actinomycetota bacterium]
MAGSGTAHLRDDGDVILSAEHLTVEFPVGNTGHVVHAVSDVSLDLRKGETLGLVGESGCGKSTTGRAILQMPRPGAGSVDFDGIDLTTLEREQLRRTRRTLQMIFQDPISALNPRRKVREIVAEPIDIWWQEEFPRSPVSRALEVYGPWLGRFLTRLWSVARYTVPVFALAILFWVVSEAVEERSAEDALGWTENVAAVLGGLGAVVAVPLLAVALALGLVWLVLGIVSPIAAIPRWFRMRSKRSEFTAMADEKVREVLHAVGIDVDNALDRRPHEFSGGQAQRISIARALVLEPEVIICDEPVSALDVSVQAQVLNLLEDLKERYGLTLIFIAHDLAVVKNVSDRVAVMYLGKMCEVAPPDQLYVEPRHPYTSALLSSVPVPDPEVVPRMPEGIEGDLPSPIAPPSGCRFRTRCPRAQERCASDEPVMEEISSGHFVACHFPLAPGEDTVATDDDFVGTAGRA